MVVASSGATLPLIDGDHSVGVPCRRKEIGEGVRHGEVGYAEGSRLQDPGRLAVSKRGLTSEVLESISAKGSKCELRI